MTLPNLPHHSALFIAIMVFLALEWWYLSRTTLPGVGR